MTRLARRIANALGLQRSVVGVLLMAVLVGSGEQLAERFLPLYLVALGSGLAWPGLLQSLHSLVGAARDGWRLFLKAMRGRGDTPRNERPRRGTVSWPSDARTMPDDPCGVFPEV